jgi:hypothetical protein
MLNPSHSLRVNYSDFLIFLEIKSRLIHESKHDWQNNDVFNYVVEEVIQKFRARDITLAVSDDIEEK